MVAKNARMGSKSRFGGRGGGRENRWISMRAIDPPTSHPPSRSFEGPATCPRWPRGFKKGFIDWLPNMANACQVCVSAIGHNARWLRGCDCHKHIWEKNVAPAKRAQLFVESGLPDGYCPLAGRRLVNLIHGGLRECQKRVKHADSDRYQQVLTMARDGVRCATLNFVNHIKSSWIDGFEDKFGFVLRPPHVIAGLLGVYFGATRQQCVDIGSQLIEHWERNRHSGKEHRVTAYLFTHETLLRELRAFVTGSSQAKPDIDQLPNLFVFALRLALITLVGHYLEGRHRGIRLQIVSGGGNTKPGLQSFKMRWKEHARNLLVN